MGLMHILRGEGIECENELQRALTFFGHRADFWDLPKLLTRPNDFLAKLAPDDWIFLPGGFSFADHLGSGRLLAFELSEINFFKEVLARGASLWGICNGFQVLAASGIFGGVKLESNQRAGKHENFTDRWVQLTIPSLSLEIQYPARHGEGRVVVGTLAPGTEPLMYYNDDKFDNGSEKKIAGLIRQIGQSTVVGTMPHPEVFIRPEQHPDFHFTNASTEGFALNSLSELRAQSLFALLEKNSRA